MTLNRLILLGSMGSLPLTLAYPRLNIPRQVGNATGVAPGIVPGNATSNAPGVVPGATGPATAPATVPATAPATVAPPPVVTYSTTQAHTPYTGVPTTTGALTAGPIGPGISPLGIPPEATTYPSDGQLHSPEPGPFIPAGGVGTNGTTPVYNAKSDFDYESLVSLRLPFPQFHAPANPLPGPCVVPRVHRARPLP